MADAALWIGGGCLIAALLGVLGTEKVDGWDAATATGAGAGAGAGAGVATAILFGADLI